MELVSEKYDTTRQPPKFMDGDELSQNKGKEVARPISKFLSPFSMVTKGEQKGRIG